MATSFCLMTIFIPPTLLSLLVIYCKEILYEENSNG